MDAYTHFLIHDLKKKKGFGASQISRELNIALRTVERHLSMPEVLEVKEKVKQKSILDPYKDEIADLLKEGYKGMQILFHLQKKGYPGGKTILHDYIREIRPAKQKAFLTLKFEPGEMAQVDFAQCGLVRAGNTRRKLYAFLMVLGYSRRIFVKFIMRMNMEHFLSCHREAFEFFGGVPRRIMVDNCKVAVIHSGNIYVPPELNPKYADFAAHYGFIINPCNVRAANEKGQVERSVGYLRSSFLNAMDTSEMSLIALNEEVRQWQLLVTDKRMLAGINQTPMQLFPAEEAAMTPLPLRSYDCSVFSRVRVSSQCRVSFEGNLYSVPMKYAGRTINMAVLPDIIRLYCDDIMITQHRRSYDRGQSIVEAAHDLELLKRRKKARKAKVLEHFLLLSPKASDYVAELRLRRPDADLHLARIMALTSTYTQSQIAQAVNEAMHLSAYGAEYIANILEMRQRVKEELAPLELRSKNEMLDIDIRQADLSIYEEE